MKRFTLVSVGLLSVAAFAQDKVVVKVGEAQEPVRYTIESSSKSTSEREMLVDGEPMGGGRGGFGGGGETTQSQKVVFDEGQDDGLTWRVYRAATAKVERPGRDGEMQANEIDGGMLDERLYMVEDDRGVVVLSGSADGEELPRMMANGLPPKTSFAGILPKEPVAVGEEFELPATFFNAMRGLFHPVRPAIDPDAFGAGRPGEQGGEGAQGGRGQRDPNRQGARGQGGFAGRRMRGTRPGPSFNLLSNDKLDGPIVGKVVEVADGIARIDIEATREGAGSLADLGMATGFGGGRGGRGGRGEVQAPEGEGSAFLEFAGSIWVDTNSHTLVKLVFEGSNKSSSHMVMNRRDREMEISSSTQGTFRVAVSTAKAPTSKKK